MIIKVDNKNNKKTTNKTSKKKQEKQPLSNPKIKTQTPQPNPKPKKKKPTPKPEKDYENVRRPLTIKEKAFCREYANSGNGVQSVYKAGYSINTDNSAGNKASRLLRKVIIRDEIERLIKKKEETAIMDAREVMELLSKVARGEIKDQFGLDASLNDRIKAMQEIAKRTIDIENRIKGVPDNQVIIKVDWKKE